MDKAILRPIYSELQGYLTQAPEIKNLCDDISNPQVWSQYNECVELLLKETNKTEYKRFLITPLSSPSYTDGFVPVVIYRQKIGGLIAALHGEYFYDEPAPFSGMPHTVITQNQQQNQNIFFQMIFEFQDKIEQSIGNFPDGSKEKTFLQKLKSSLRNVTDVSKLVLELTKIAKESGLSAEDLFRIFS